MKSLFDFIVEPLNTQYNNEIKVGDKSLVTNADLDNFRAVSNMAKVISTPLAYKTKISEGDTIVIPSNYKHYGTALTDCKIMDVFCPKREEYK